MKILPTIGPISEDTSSLKKLNKFTNIFRLNGSHNNLEWHKKIIKRIKNINKKNNILLDIPGVKPRTKNETDIFIKKKQLVIFYYNKKKLNFFKKNLSIQLTHPIPEIARYAKTFTISDGAYLFKIHKISKNYVSGVSQQDFILKPKKGLNIPKSIYDNKRQLKLSLKFLSNVKNFKFDAIGLSFVQDEKVVKNIKKKYSDRLIVSKIENSKGLENIISIVKFSDIIMIDRGDLAAEIGAENLFNAIKKISEECKYQGKPLIMATENLDSMMLNSSPTKSEIISLGFSDYINSDLIMLSDETATSKNYLRITKWLYNFIYRFKNQNYKTSIIDEDYFWNILKDINKNVLVVFTKKGYVIEKLLRINKNINLFVFSDNEKVIKYSNFRSNTQTILTSSFPKKMEDFISTYIRKYKNKIFKDQKKVFLTYLSYPKKGLRANTVSLISENSFN
jgi:pyruvate kinase